MCQTSNILSMRLVCKGPDLSGKQTPHDDRRRTNRAREQMATVFAVSRIKYRDWNQKGLWSFGAEDEASENGFYRIEVLKGPLPLNCGGTGGRRCKRPKCLQCEIIKGESWHPHLPGTEMGQTAHAVHVVRRCEADPGPMEDAFPGPVCSR